MSHPGFVDKVARTIARNHLFAAGERVLMAVSGGPDSMALLESLGLLADRFDVGLAVAHLDHGLRGEEGGEDSGFVEAEARRRGLPFYGGREDVRAYRALSHGSLEEAAREVRSRFLRQAAAALGAEKIALGHTANDQAETVLLNLLRGAGRRGLGAMPAIREGLWVRPLLECRRTEVEAFLRERSVPFVVDPTNVLDIYRRNRLRHEVLPRLEEVFGSGVIAVLARSAEILQEEEGFLESLARQSYAAARRGGRQGEIVLDREELATYPLAIRRRVLRLAARELGLTSGPSSLHVAALLALLGGEDPGAEVALPRGFRARREYGLLRFSDEPREEKVSRSSELPVPGSLDLQWCEIRLTASLENREGAEVPVSSPREAFFDADGVEYPLRVRNRREGDRFRPLGGPGGKKLKEFLIDEKQPRRQRDFIPLVVSGERILWVVGLRLSAWARPGRETRRLLRIRAEALDSAFRGDRPWAAHWKS